MSVNEKNLELLLDVDVNVYVRLGSCSLPMKEIVNLDTGSLIQLKEKTEDLAEIFVNNKLVARGEIIVIDDHLGVKIKEMLNIENKAEEDK